MGDINKAMFVLLFTTASLAIAAPQASIDISSLPTCATTGALSAIQSTGCQLTDIACICKSKPFVNSLKAYAQANCNGADLETALNFGESVCASVGVNIDDPSSADAGDSNTDAPVSTATLISVTESDGVASTTMITATVTGFYNNGTVASSTSSDIEDCACSHTKTPIATSAVATFTGAASAVKNGPLNMLELGVAGFVAGVAAILL